MKMDRRLLIAVAVVALTSLVWMLSTAGLIAATVQPAQRDAIAELLVSRWLLIAMSWAIAVFSIAAALRLLFRRYAKAPARLLEQTRVLLAAEKPVPMHHSGTRETTALAEVILELSQQRDSLREDVASKVADASLIVRQERNRLAALVAELTQSVVVCNLDGRILFYNSRARLQFKTISKTTTLACGADLMGIGRSIYAVFDRQLVAHALENIRERLARGASNHSAQFVTTTQGGQLLRVQVSPVLQVDAPAQSTHMDGFILMLENLTRSFEDAHVRDQAIHGLVERSISSLAVIKSAATGLAATAVPAADRPTLEAELRDALNSMEARLADIRKSTLKGMKARWPLEDMLGTDLMMAARRRIEARKLRTVTLESTDTSLWLRVDSFSLAQALDYLSERLLDEYAIKTVRLRLQAVNDRAYLDLVWVGQAMSTETAMGWEMDAMQLGTQATPLTVRDVVERHSGEIWFERERARHEAFFRFSLPLAALADRQAQPELLATDSRPEYYDFALFQTTGSSGAMDDRLLSELSYTVFDTETTGLHPSEGDQIIQIGAARCVNGKLVKQETFEQLVNPGRLIPAATIAIHGITQDMVRGQPDITEVLPSFYAFADDTVLVAHNAAFDMKFLQLQERNTGLVFDHPVLDTLLLSAIVHPSHESHRLEAIAERFSINVVGRHTALADALVTAEVFLRLIPLLRAMGIHTLGQAREAAQKTYYARLKY